MKSSKHLNTGTNNLIGAIDSIGTEMTSRTKINTKKLRSIIDEIHAIYQNVFDNEQKLIMCYVVMLYLYLTEKRPELGNMTCLEHHCKIHDLTIHQGLMRMVGKSKKLLKSKVGDK